MGKKSEIFYLPTLKVTKSRVHLHATLTMRAWHSKMSYWRREKRLRKATVTFTQCRAEWLLLMTATGGVECVYLRVCVFMQEWVTIFPCLSVFVFLCLLLWGRQSELLFFWMYVSVPVCGSVCVPRKGTEAKKIIHQYEWKRAMFLTTHWHVTSYLSHLKGEHPVVPCALTLQSWVVLSCSSHTTATISGTAGLQISDPQQPHWHYCNAQQLSSSHDKFTEYWTAWPAITLLVFLQHHS